MRPDDVVGRSSWIVRNRTGSDGWIAFHGLATTCSIASRRRLLPQRMTAEVTLRIGLNSQASMAWVWATQSATASYWVALGR